MSDSMRVVSLLPSATEILFEIGAGDLLVGRSHECDWPIGLVERVPILTGQRVESSDGSSGEIDAQVRHQLGAGGDLYTLDADLLRELKPDVILTQDLCEVCSISLNTVRRIADSMPDPKPVIVSLNPQSVEDVFDDLLRVGQAVGREENAQRAMVHRRARYFAARDHVNVLAGDQPEVAFLEWTDPLFVGGHWTPQLIEFAGGRHSLNPAGQKSRQVTVEELAQSQPEFLIVCPCGFDLERTMRETDQLAKQPWFQTLPAVRRSDCVAMVDGNMMFNRPGPRLIDAYEFLVGWLNGIDGLIPNDFPWRRRHGQ